MQGRRDIPLNARGHEQARELAERVSAEQIAALWTSHLGRARQTAAAVTAVTGIEAEVDERLAESHCGDWEGRLVADIERDDGHAWGAYRSDPAGFRYPGGESLVEHQRRVVASLADVAQGPLPALVVCHGGTIRCALLDGDERGLGAYHEVRVRNAALFRLTSPS